MHITHMIGFFHKLVYLFMLTCMYVSCISGGNKDYYLLFLMHNYRHNHHNYTVLI